MPVRVSVEFDERRVLAGVAAANARALKGAGAYVRQAARHSISISPAPSGRGNPPHSRRGALKRAILFGYDPARQAAIVGPAQSFIGVSGSAHEFGGRYKDENYPERPFMFPALRKSAAKLPALWRDAVTTRSTP